MSRYRVIVDLVVYADSEAEALQNVGIGLEYYDVKSGEFGIDGIGSPYGRVVVEEVKRG